MTNTLIPYSIRWLMDREHVGTPDEEIRQDILSRAKKGGLDILTAVAFADMAIARMDENRVHYAFVMGSH